MEKFTLHVKITGFYDVEVLAEDFHEAIEKVSTIDGYQLLTKEIPVDSDPVELTSVTGNEKL